MKEEHGISFSTVLDIFSDPFALEFVDEAHSTEHETRYAIIGLTSVGLVFLVYTEPEIDHVHFVTARFAERWMVDEYEENK